MKTALEKRYHELMEQASNAMIEAGKVRDRTDLTDSEKYELIKKLNRKSVALHNQAVACWKMVHGSDAQMQTLTPDE